MGAIEVDSRANVKRFRGKQHRLQFVWVEVAVNLESNPHFHIPANLLKVSHGRCSSELQGKRSKGPRPPGTGAP